MQTVLRKTTIFQILLEKKSLFSRFVLLLGKTNTQQNTVTIDLFLSRPGSEDDARRTTTV